MAQVSVYCFCPRDGLAHGRRDLEKLPEGWFGHVSMYKNEMEIRYSNYNLKTRLWWNQLGPWQDGLGSERLVSPSTLSTA